MGFNQLQLVQSNDPRSKLIGVTGAIDDSTMAGKSAMRRKKSEGLNPKFFENPKLAFPFFLLVADALLVFLIITYVPYTKIDWDAYMSQVNGFLAGERDYRNLKGDTGPLVYPAGFLYVYTAIQYVTGGEVYPAQILFGILYFINMGIILFIYVKTEVLPWWALALLCLSKRMHSIFVLRLFNDCLAMMLLHAALASIIYQRWHLGLIIFSGAVSVKMNVLLYAPSLLLLMLKAMDISGVISALASAALVQILLGLPFIISHPLAYVSRAFNLGRIFIHFWSVNFKFVPEPIFISKAFAVLLLIAHLVLLTAFAHLRWCKHEGGILKFVHTIFVSVKLKFSHASSTSSKNSHDSQTSLKILKKEYIVTTMFVGNFIGIICARSLHYQFYSWYFYSLPYLLWRTHFPTLLRLILFMGVEFCWNVYPSNSYSSALLVSLHLVILYGLWSAPAEYPYNDKMLWEVEPSLVRVLFTCQAHFSYKVEFKFCSGDVIVLTYLLNMDGHDAEDPKQSTADMSAFVQDLLQQMQCRFQAMSDSIVTKNILYSCTVVLLSLLQDYSEKSTFLGTCVRINELEQSINDLKAEMGMEGSPSPMAPSKPSPDEVKKDEGSA
ncbi:hypothetical protein FNV43_RR23517 [Rhamnella rubrinervis]|uniref:dolichyl-P-Man:Man5GlcNAc2-PP-dolichol alpha-1,3-mannosyltransferase n=1 Tax=Rhamnella rubrinervis TaxID=2594499 RepID=A0A8K0DZ29_9ROSA|nr:hypothetical protein FNV43_RR23517 [Rhamnella rubrinervis]